MKKSLSFITYSDQDEKGGSKRLPLHQDLQIYLVIYETLLFGPNN